jgi:hypothetical protein
VWLLVDADRNPKTGWAGYDFVVNRTAAGGFASIERNEGNAWSWTKVANSPVGMRGSELQIAIPRAVVGLPNGPIAFDFKWVDNLQRPGDVMDFYLSGDVAPEGRFNYRYAAD